MSQVQWRGTEQSRITVLKKKMSFITIYLSNHLLISVACDDYVYCPLGRLVHVLFTLHLCGLIVKAEVGFYSLEKVRDDVVSINHNDIC